MTQRNGLDQIIEDFDLLLDYKSDLELEAVKAAILIEDLLGITLADDDIGPAMFSGDGLKGLVTRLRNPPS